MESMGYGNGTWVLGQNSSENSCNSCNLSTFRLTAIVRFDDEGLLSHICKPQNSDKTRRRPGSEAELVVGSLDQHPSVPSRFQTQ